MARKDSGSLFPFVLNEIRLYFSISLCRKCISVSVYTFAPFWWSGFPSLKSQFFQPKSKCPHLHQVPKSRFRCVRKVDERKKICFLSSQNEDVVESELGVQKSTNTIAPERSQTGFYTISYIRTRICISMANLATFFFYLLNPTF